MTGKFRGASHNKCYLDYNFKNFKLPVFFYNFKGYDANLVINGIKKEHNVTCIAQNTQKFISFGINKIVFKDSNAFLQSSLERMVDTLNPEDFVHLKERFRDDWEIMKHKGV